MDIIWLLLGVFTNYWIFLQFGHWVRLFSLKLLRHLNNYDSELVRNTVVTNGVVICALLWHSRNPLSSASAPEVFYRVVIIVDSVMRMKAAWVRIITSSWWSTSHWHIWGTKSSILGRKRTWNYHNLEWISMRRKLNIHVEDKANGTQIKL